MEIAGLPAKAPFRRSIVKISTDQVKKALLANQAASPDMKVVDDAVVRLLDGKLIDAVVEKVREMPDREEVVASLKARVEAGTYRPDAMDIADAMIRRAIADSLS